MFFLVIDNELAPALVKTVEGICVCSSVSVPVSLEVERQGCRTGVRPSMKQPAVECKNADVANHKHISLLF